MDPIQSHIELEQLRQENNSLKLRIEALEEELTKLKEDIKHDRWERDERE